jgi:C-terminal processing protease CtpA/Prc
MNHRFSAARPPALVGPDAGLRVGDILRQVDGCNAADLSHAEIKEILSRAGTTCTVTVERQGTMKTATLQLRRRL